MKAPELSLPEAVRQKASVSAGGEHAWRQSDVEEAIEAARKAQLGCQGGLVPFQSRDGTCEAYCLDFDPPARLENESWEAYVSRSNDQALDGCRRVCRETDFRSVAREWEFLRTKIERGYDPIDDLWFVLYFVNDSTPRVL
jgi:hypothetical protein